MTLAGEETVAGKGGDWWSSWHGMWSDRDCTGGLVRAKLIE